MCFGSPVQPRNRKVTAQSVAHTPEFVVRSLKIAVSFSEIGDGLSKSPYGTGLLPKAIESVLKSIECLFPNSDSLCVSTAVLGPIGGSFLIVIWPFFLGNALAKTLGIRCFLNEMDLFLLFVPQVSRAVGQNKGIFHTSLLNSGHQDRYYQ